MKPVEYHLAPPNRWSAWLRKIAIIATGAAALVALSGCCTPAGAANTGLPPVTLQAEVYGGLNPSFGASSSSGFFRGQAADTTVWGLGATAHYKLGGTPIPHVRWGLGVTVDWMTKSLKYTGTGGFGAFPVAGRGGISQWDFLLGPRFMTHPPGDDKWTYALYARGGFALVTPTGMPTGIGGPAFSSTATVPAFRLGVEVLRHFCYCYKFGFFVAYQYSGPARYSTTLPGEYFRLSADHRVLAGLEFNWDMNEGPEARRERERAGLQIR